MKRRVGWFLGIGGMLIVGAIVTQSLLSNATTLGNLEALWMLMKPETGRQLTPDEIASGQFRHLSLNVYGLSCMSCSNAIAIGVVNIKGIVNAKIQQGKSCIIYDSRQITKQGILTSVIFTSGTYMATGADEAVIRSESEAKCL